MSFFSSTEENSISESSVYSFSDTVSKKHRRRRVKSGANIRTRPVVKTELWPHTIANEDDGENISSEDISLSKFYSCFTNIMINCVNDSEVKGRAVLLHAISTVLECLPWREARVFHNITMLKIEQDRIKWSADFVALAGQFLDRKVRLSLKLKRDASNARSHYPCNDKKYGQGCDNHNFRVKENFYANRSRFLYHVICNQWNHGECSYGSGCKRWHVCQSCAAEGKLGEPHKSSSHDTSSMKIVDLNQRV